MSQMDAVSPVEHLLPKRQNGDIQLLRSQTMLVSNRFPEAYHAGKKNGIKVIYGMEANLVDDGVPIAYNEAHRILRRRYICRI